MDYHSTVLELSLAETTESRHTKMCAIVYNRPQTNCLCLVVGCVWPFFADHFKVQYRILCMVYCKAIRAELFTLHTFSFIRFCSVLWQRAFSPYRVLVLFVFFDLYCAGMYFQWLSKEHAVIYTCVQLKTLFDVHVKYPKQTFQTMLSSPKSLQAVFLLRLNYVY